MAEVLTTAVRLCAHPAMDAPIRASKTGAQVEILVLKRCLYNIDQVDSANLGHLLNLTIRISRMRRDVRRTEVEWRWLHGGAAAAV